MNISKATILLSCKCQESKLMGAKYNCVKNENDSNYTAHCSLYNTSTVGHGETKQSAKRNAAASMCQIFEENLPLFIKNHEAIFCQPKSIVNRKCIRLKLPKPKYKKIGREENSTRVTVSCTISNISTIGYAASVQKACQVAASLMNEKFGENDDIYETEQKEILSELIKVFGNAPQSSQDKMEKRYPEKISYVKEQIRKLKQND